MSPRPPLWSAAVPRVRPRARGRGDPLARHPPPRGDARGSPLRAPAGLGRGRFPLVRLRFQQPDFSLQQVVSDSQSDRVIKANLRLGGPHPHLTPPTRAHPRDPPGSDPALP